jgi:hypothetical protein
VPETRAGPSSGASRDKRTGPRVGQGGESLRESKDLLEIGTESCHHGAGASSEAALASEDHLLLFRQGPEVVLGDAIDEPFDPAAIVDPPAGGVVGAGGM